MSRIPKASKAVYAEKINVDYLEKIGFPIEALLELISLCAYGCERHGADTWREKPPSYHRRHYIEHDIGDMEPEEESLRPNRVHCALRELMFCQAKLFRYGPKIISDDIMP